MEQTYERMNRLGVPLNIVTICRIKGPLNADILRKALDFSQHRHPRLNSRIIGSLEHLRFETEGTQKIPLRVIEGVDDQHWHEVVISELNKKIEAHRVLMRTTLLYHSNNNSTRYLITTTHHAIADALSLVKLHQEILTFCQKIFKGESIEVPCLAALPPVDEIIRESGKISLQSQENRLENLNFESLTFEKNVPMEMRRTGMLHRQLEKVFTRKFIKRCKQEKTRIHGALCAVMLLTVVEKIRAEREIRVSCRASVDLRKRFKPMISSEHLAPIVSVISTFHTITPHTSFWELAREVTQQLEVVLERGDIFRAHSNFHKKTKTVTAEQSKALATISLANVGMLDIPSVYEPFVLEEISLYLAVSAYGGLFCAVFSVFKGRMYFNFPFSEPSISRNNMEIMVDNCLAYLIDNI